MHIKLTFQIIFESDYHVSDGQRVGLSVDSALLRDHNKAPVLRGTALAGLLKDGICDLQDLLAQSSLSPLQDDVKKRIFGDPGVPKQWAFSSTSPLTEDRVNGRFATNNVWRVRINPRTRRADPQKLFLQEEGDQRLRFTFTATCAGLTDQHRADAAALVAAASMVRHLGSGRRRGKGHCRFELIEAENFIDMDKEKSWQEAALDVFKSHWIEGTELQSIQLPQLPTLEEDDQPKRFRLIARLVEPLIMAKKSQVANAFETQDMIPGTVLLGALASRTAQKLDLGEAKNHVHFSHMFLRGGVASTGLLPAKFDTRLYPSMPSPRSWAQCELYPEFGPNSVSKPHLLHDLSQSNDEDECPDCKSKLEKVSGYINLTKTQRQSHPVETRDDMHITMERDTGRVREGDLFTYEAIKGGQWFVGELNCEPGAWPTLYTYAGLRAGEINKIRLGKAIRRGYGLTHLFIEEINQNEPSPWMMQPLSERLPEKETTLDLTMLFLTDAILLDKWSCFQHGIDRQTLADLLHVDISKIGENVQPYLHSRILDNFNTHRQIPRWRDEAIAAGSMARFSLMVKDQHEAITILQKVEDAGIGLRRHEGYGRVAFNHPVFNQKPGVGGIRLSREARSLRQIADSNSHVTQATETIRGEARFVSAWQDALDTSWKANHSKWNSIGDDFEPVARLIYLYRFKPLSELQDWFTGNGRNLGDERNLWGSRKLTGRDKQLKLDKELLDPIVDLLNTLSAENDAFHTKGLTMLSERLGAQINVNRQDASKEEKSHA